MRQIELGLLKLMGFIQFSGMVILARHFLASPENMDAIRRHFFNFET